MRVEYDGTTLLLIAENNVDPVSLESLAGRDDARVVRRYVGALYGYGSTKFAKGSIVELELKLP